MADLFSEKHRKPVVLAQRDDAARDVAAADDTAEQHNKAPDREPGEPPADIVAFIELFFFAYRDFVRDPDHILENFGFGRAHHRVLHFVCRHPGIRVARLLDVLNITKQSLARVLRQLIEEGYVEQQAGKSDRRERRLFLTDNGTMLYKQLVAPQRTRVADALVAAGLTGDDASYQRNAVEKFLFAMITEQDRSDIKALIEAGVTPGSENSEAA
jgi:DNA-binding MarR family transcriptional regulator